MLREHGHPHFSPQGALALRKAGAGDSPTFSCPACRCHGGCHESIPALPLREPGCGLSILVSTAPRADTTDVTSDLALPGRSHYEWLLSP